MSFQTYHQPASRVKPRRAAAPRRVVYFIIVHRLGSALLLLTLSFVSVPARLAAAPTATPAPAPLTDPWLIVPGQSMGLLRLGSPMRVVSQTPGWAAPDRTHIVGTISYLTYNRHGVTIAVRDETAVMMLTTNERFRTERGVAVGKASSTVAAAYGASGSGDDRTAWYDAIGMVVVSGGNTIVRLGVYDPKTLVRVILIEERPARDVFLTARNPKVGPAPPKADAGSRSLTISITLKNTASTAKVLNPNFLTLLDTAGRSYRYHASTFGQKDACRSTVMVRTGDAASCSIVFVLPAGATPRTIVYSDGASIDETWL
jgi:hypothetical protein